MKTSSAFWDTSAIVPLCVFQEATVAARSERRKFSTCAIWWGAKVEIHSSLARLRKSGVLLQPSFAVASNKLAEFQKPARIILPTNKMLAIAAELPERLGLRTLDAFQLASALIWCDERPRKRPFICADRRLGEAAKEAGFDVTLIS